MTTPVIAPKKLIEVALPLDAINVAAAREKSIRHGHPSTLHLWWARRPLAAARAVIFAQLVNDPADLWRCKNPGKEPNQQEKGHWTKARAKLFTIIEDLVKWENTTNETVLEPAREEIRKSWRDVCDLNKDHPRAKELFDPKKMPGLHDPFAGGGTIPLEAQRLGLEAFASDLNPVAVLINKAMIEIPPKFAGRPPVNPEARKQSGLMEKRDWKGAQGLAEDVRYYGVWMRDEAKKRIGHLYPPVEVTKEMAEDRTDLKPYVGQKLTVIAWLWARTVKSPNPAFAHVDVPLATTFILASKEGKEAYVQPIIDGDNYRFTVKVGTPPENVKEGTKAARGSFRCLLSHVPIGSSHLQAEGKAGRISSRMIAAVAEGNVGRVYLSPTPEMERVARSAQPAWKPDVAFFQQALGFRIGNYGMSMWSDLFSPRQLVAMTTFSDLVGDVGLKVRQDAVAAGLPDDGRGLDAGGTETTTYADAVCVYLGLCSSKLSAYHCTMATWRAPEGKSARAFGRQAISMVWDYVECNPFAEAGGEFTGAVLDCAKVLDTFPAQKQGRAIQQAAQEENLSLALQRIISTDPPYYDNVGYADLSDFYYVWLRHSLRSVFTTLLATIVVPKAEELVATPARHGGRENAETFFLTGMTRAIHRLATQAHLAFPTTIYYAFKQSESDGADGIASTGWETFLDAVLRSGFAVTGTWPMRTEQVAALKATRNALASCIILVCRPRAKDAPTTSRRAFIRELNAALPLALDEMTRESEGLHSPVAPVDLSQAIIGPGMAIFSKYSAVLEADGKPMSVRTALQLINRFLAEGDFDADTQFCLRWFEQHGWDEGQFGEADTLARAKGTAVKGVADAGVIASGGGSVRLLKWNEYPSDWNPDTDDRLPVWELLHHLIRLHRTGGEADAGRVLASSRCASKAEPARQLAYRLYTLSERAKRAEDARAYNEVVTGWSAIEAAAATAPPLPKKSKNETMDIPFEEDAQ